MSEAFERFVMRAIAPVARRLRLSIGRGVVTGIDDDGKVQTAQVKLLDGEVRDGVEVLLQYGVHSRAPGNPEGVYLSVGGDRDHGILINIADRQFRMTSLKKGEVALADDLGQKIHLTRDGIVVDGADLPIIFKNAPKVRFETPLFECTGEIKDLCDTSGKEMSGMRSTYNDHDHNETQSVTDTPNQSM